MSLYDRLKGQSPQGTSERRTYSFQNKPQTQQSRSTTNRSENRPAQGSGRFRARSKSTPTPKSPTSFAPPAVRGKNYIDDTDKPYAYDPPVLYADEGIEVYHPTTRDKFIDLGLRIIEAIVPAIAGAVYQEIAHFFTKRRFYKQDYRR